jgi:type I restriction-modification system DNA methylase subunit
MGNAGRNGGEYYTPRPLIRAMIQVVKPKIGDRIYDGACGSAGFLCESYDYLRQGKLTTKQLETLQKHTFTGKEKKSLAYVIAIMNMILHGIDAPNIIHSNTLTENLSDIQDKNRFDVILANPPFGGKERKEIQQNFPSQGKPLTEGMATQKIWYYQLEPGRNMGKTNALNDEDLREFVELQATFAESEKSWLVDIADIDRVTFDLSVKNPNKA